MKMISDIKESKSNFINISKSEFQQKPQEVQDSTDGVFIRESQIDKKLTPLNKNLRLSINDVRNVALLKYKSVAGFGRSLGITHGLASRLLTGGYIPLKPESILKISDALGIDPILLTQIYSDCKTKKEAGSKEQPLLSKINDGDAHDTKV